MLAVPAMCQAAASSPPGAPAPSARTGPAAAQKVGSRAETEAGHPLLFVRSGPKSMAVQDLKERVELGIVKTAKLCTQVHCC